MVRNGYYALMGINISEFSRSELNGFIIVYINTKVAIC